MSQGNGSEAICLIIDQIEPDTPMLDFRVRN